MAVFRLSALTALVVVLVVAPSASAGVPHTVVEGETLWSLAAQNNFTTRAFAAANGLPEDAQIVVGSTITIPSEAEAAAAMAAAGIAPAPAAAPAAVVPPEATATGAATAPAVATSAATTVPVAESPPAALPATDGDDPKPTPETTTADEIGQIAAEHGVSPSLASAIAWQESGFNNNVVSSSDARGVMQIIPSTWDYIQENLAGGTLHPASANENVHAGVMYIADLAEQWGGDETAAIASYYQGPTAVREHGLYEDTQQYVENVKAHRVRFGGP